MSKQPKKTITLHELAERPVTIALSIAEMVIIQKHHIAQLRRLPKELGKAFITAPKESHKYLLQGCKEQLEAHSLRAKGLGTIIRDHI